MLLLAETWWTYKGSFFGTLTGHLQIKINSDKFLPVLFGINFMHQYSVHPRHSYNKHNKYESIILFYGMNNYNYITFI